jgi:hypothetical protein
MLGQNTLGALGLGNMETPSAPLDVDVQQGDAYSPHGWRADIDRLFRHLSQMTEQNTPDQVSFLQYLEHKIRDLEANTPWRVRFMNAGESSSTAANTVPDTICVASLKRKRGVQQEAPRAPEPFGKAPKGTGTVAASFGTS